ncbi:ADP-heptose:LPS heptosyltransferase [Nocardioides terrae]|uniref:ADP-heptose:LPS heptosyltransferase n=1 Tax=Nocardioides terrae TaxID=574651 RepID=A0A1I1IBL1_9ACTN|nr:ADP-heptose:LPS heptosyltransferase [Nocardioides terrae]
MRALVYRAIGLGDLLTGVPALRALRRALPGHQIVLAAPGSQRPLVELVDAVDRLIPTAELEPVAWDGPPPEVGIDLHGNGLASRSLVEALSPGRLLAYDLSTWNPDEHERVRWCRLVASAWDVRADPDDVLLRPPSCAPPVARAAIVHPGAASGSRRWPAERFAAVAAALRDAGEEVVVTGSPDERDLAERVASLAGLRPEAVLAGRTDLGHLAALVADARLVVAGDTGVAHLASAYATPSVLLFGPTPPSRWGPPPGPHTVLWQGTGVGDPHAADPDPALLEITVDEVLMAAYGVLRPGGLSNRTA